MALPQHDSVDSIKSDFVKPPDSAKKEKKRAPYHFGEKLRRAREHKGLTLKVVAEKADVSESLVSQIERNRVSPAIDTLLALADALDVNLEFLFDEYRRERPVKIIRAGERRAIDEDGVIYEEIAKSYDKNRGQALEAYVIKIPAGLRTHRGSYGHIGHEYGIITKGGVVLKYEKNEYALEAGDSVSFPAGSHHSLENRTKSAAEAIWVVTPPQRFAD